MYAPSRRRVSRVFGVVGALLVVVVLAGCGADRHLQHQESAVRARTCQSLLERRFGRPPPSIGADHWLRDTERTPALHGRANQSEVVRECNRIGDQLGGSDAGVRGAAWVISRLASSIGAGGPSSGASPGASGGASSSSDAPDVSTP